MKSIYLIGLMLGTSCNNQQDIYCEPIRNDLKQHLQWVIDNPADNDCYAQMMQVYAKYMNECNEVPKYEVKYEQPKVYFISFTTNKGEWIQE